MGAIGLSKCASKSPSYTKMQMVQYIQHFTTDKTRQTNASLYRAIQVLDLNHAHNFQLDCDKQQPKTMQQPPGRLIKLPEIESNRNLAT